MARKDLSGLDLSNLRFDGVNLAGSNLSNTRNSNTAYESSRLDGANFSDAVFRDSTIEHVFGVNSRWDRAQFDQTSMVFNNFGNASFRDAAFRDRVLSRDREEPSSKQGRSGEEGEDKIRVTSSGRAPGNAGWGEFAARAGSFLSDIGKGLKDVSAEVYQKVRDWWAQPLQLAPEIDRNPAAAWAAQMPPAYGGTQERQPQAWDARQAELAQTQIYKHRNERSNPETLRPERVSEEKRKQQIPEPGRSAEDRGNGTQEHRTVSTNAASAPERVQPALIARNNFQFADLTGARFESIRVQDNDFRHAVLTDAHFPGELAESNNVERGVEASSRKGGLDASVKDAVEPIRQMKTEAERKEDRAKLAETILRDIDSREQKLREGDSGQYRDADAMHLAKEMLRQVEAGADRIDLTTAYTAADQTAAEERHVRAYNAVNPFIAEAYAKGITVDRGSASLERAQAITDEAARLHDDVNATNNRLDRKELWPRRRISRQRACRCEQKARQKRTASDQNWIAKVLRR